MTKKNNKSLNSDNELFRSSIGEVRPLKKQNQADIPKNQPKPTVKNPIQTTEPINYALSNFAAEHDLSSPDEFLGHRGNGLQIRQYKKLKLGRYAIEARLDLHGYNTEKATDQLSLFLQECREQQLKCAIIVHGKGSIGKRPVLKSLLKHWLKQIPDIIAYCTAQPKDGGTGAIYILLKSQNINQES